MSINIMYKVVVGSLLVGLSLNSVHALERLSDDELAMTTGQTLLGINYTAPGALGNPTNGANANVGFYKISLNAELEINANIGNMRLGCSGDVNSTSVATRNCDIDIDKVRLSGLEITPQTTKTRNTAPATDFKMTNPYIELAIRNPTGTDNRELIGFRTGAANSRGVMSAGDRPYDANGNVVVSSNPADHSGINRLSGYMDLWLGDGVNQNITALCGSTTACLTNPPAAGSGIFAGVGISPISIGGIWAPSDGSANSWGVVQAFPNGRPAQVQSGVTCSVNIGLFGNSTGCQAGRNDLAIAAGTNIFKKQYSARSDTLTLGVVNILTNIRALNANDTQMSKARLVIPLVMSHSFTIGNPANSTEQQEFGFYFSKVGNRTLTAIPTNVATAVDRKPSAPDTWLKWRDNSGVWNPVSQGWSIGLGKVVAADYVSAVSKVGAIEGLGTISINNLDLRQVPIDNCWGDKVFC